MLCFQDICDAAIFYADLIHAKLKSAGYYDEEGQFDVTEQVVTKQSLYFVPLGCERLHMPLCKVADTHFHIHGDDMIYNFTDFVARDFICFRYIHQVSLVE